MSEQATRRWPRLRPRDRVRLISPASYPEGAEEAAAVAVLESWGLVAEVGIHAHDRWGYMAGRDEDRLADLTDAFRDPGVRAIVAIRGGAGAYRIAHRIDFAAVRADPKPVVGFSDITALHLALYGECHLVTIHGHLSGPMATPTARALLMESDPVELRSDPATTSGAVRVAGRATGPLVGGGLATVAHAVGAGLPSLDGAILLLEDVRAIGIGRVDRQLTQLTRSGALDALAGVALGRFSGYEGYVDRGWGLADVLHDHLDALGVPVLGGLPVGHDLGRDHDQTCVALGAPAEPVKSFETIGQGFF